MKKRLAKKIYRNQYECYYVPYPDGTWEHRYVYNDEQRRRARAIHLKRGWYGHTMRLVRRFGKRDPAFEDWRFMSLPQDQQRALLARWDNVVYPMLDKGTRWDTDPEGDAHAHNAAHEDMSRTLAEGRCIEDRILGDLDYFSDRWCRTRVIRMAVYMDYLRQQVNSGPA